MSSKRIASAVMARRVDQDILKHLAVDALVQAVFDKLPPAAEPFPAAARLAWLKLMAGVFDVAYGVDRAITIDLAPFEADELPNPLPPRGVTFPMAPKPGEVLTTAVLHRMAHEQAGCDFYVDEAGLVRSDVSVGPKGLPVPTPHRRVLQDEIGDSQIYDYRGAARNRETVIWADDTMGSEPGMSFCGPG